jgi:hypothetical protein
VQAFVKAEKARLRELAVTYSRKARLGSEVQAVVWIMQLPEEITRLLESAKARPDGGKHLVCELLHILSACRQMLMDLK